MDWFLYSRDFCPERVKDLLDTKLKGRDIKHSTKGAFEIEDSSQN